MSKQVHEVLVRPLLTEKSVRSNEAKKYIFEVKMDATKIDIARAIEELYSKEKVKVSSVNTLHVRGKERRMNMKRGRRASVGTTPAWKKAVVTLTADSPAITLIEGV